MAVHIFGAVSLLTTCIIALCKTGDDFDHLYPKIASLVKTNIYVDNYFDSTETEKEAIVRRKDITTLLKYHSMGLVLPLSPLHFQRSGFVEIPRPGSELLPTERILGHLWDCQTDSFIFKTTTKAIVKTKREVLQRISSIHDPLGFLALVVMTERSKHI